jgi:hypothetical protein
MVSTAGNRCQEADANLTVHELAGQVPTPIVKARDAVENRVRDPSTGRIQGRAAFIDAHGTHDRARHYPGLNPTSTPPFSTIKCIRINTAYPCVVVNRVGDITTQSLSQLNAF